MEHLRGITVEDLQRALDSVDDKKPTMRLIAAIAYKNGVTQSELAAWFDVERKTIYNWLSRFEEGDIESAITDDPRAGRPRKLSDDQLSELATILQNPPTAAGYDAPAWTTDLVRTLIRDQFEIDYSPPSCRRLMADAGLQHLPAREAVDAVGHEDPEAFERAVLELGHVWVPR